MFDAGDDTGYPRAYFHRRFVIAARTVIERNPHMNQRSQRPVMAAIRMSVDDAVSRLRFCPVCRAELTHYNDFPTERSCECGDFTLTAMWTSGDVVFEFTMLAEKTEEGEEDASDDRA